MQNLLKTKDFEALLEFHQENDGSRRVLSKNAIRMGECIVKIPKYLELFNDDELDIPEVDLCRLSNNGQYEYGISTFKLMIHMIDILHSNLEDEKYFYLKSLPRHFNLPIEWEEQKLNLIKGTDLYKITMEKKKWLKDATEIAHGLKCKSIGATIENMTWAYSVISSRSFPKSPGKVCLWPILDYLDHDANSKIEWIITDSEIKFIAMEDIPKQVIVYNNYGPKGNENLLNNYGFVIVDNPYDYVKVTLNSGNDHLYQEKKALVQGIFKDYWLLFKDDSKVPDGLIKLCRVLLCNDFEWFMLDKSSIDNIKVISIRNEVATFMSLIQLLQSKLEPYLQSQQRLMAVEKERDLMIYINSHVNILMHHLQLCRLHLDTLISSVDFFCLDHMDLDEEFLNFSQDMADVDEDTLLCLCLIHEKESNSIFSERLANLEISLIHDLEEEAHFQTIVLPYFASDHITFENLKWASAVLSIHGGYDTKEMNDNKNLIYASFSALVARLICHPLDTLKTQIQVDFGSGGLAQGIKQIHKQGLSAFYKGLPIASIFSIPGLSTYLYLYDSLKEKLEKDWGTENSMAIHAISGAIAECGSGLFWTPMEVIKNKQQYENRSLRSVVKNVMKEDGIRGFGRGYLISLGVFVPYSMAYFVSYEEMKSFAIERIHDGDDLSFGTYLTCSALSGAVAASVSNCLDVLKTRVQITGGRPWSIIKEMIRTDGLRSLIKGIGARVLWITPSVTISMTTYEFLKQHEFTF